VSNPLKPFSTNLKTLRLKRGLTQEDVAWRARMPPASYSRLERGHGNPTMRTVARLAGALGTHAGELLRGVREEPRR
jgi:transcriptional regulator with XRE-family HTH domain